MILIPGFIIALLTFPGVIVHETGHLLFCRLRKVEVTEACYFRLGNPAGYIVHAATDNFLDTLLICLGPFFLNSLLCLLLCLPAFIPYKVYGREHDPLVLFQLWLGVSIGMHAFPSTGDARNLWTHAREAAREGSALAWFSFPLVGFIYLANLASVFWFDAIYGIALGVGLPMLVLHLLGITS